MAQRRKADTSGVFTFFNEINIIAQLSTGMFERNLPHGLTVSQFSVLNWFVRVDSVASPSRLARAFQVTGGAMTNTLKKLEGKGFINVEPDETSGRQKRVTITDEGMKARAEAIESSGPLLAEFAAVFQQAEIDGLTQQLAEIRRYLDEYRYQRP